MVELEETAKEITKDAKRCRALIKNRNFKWYIGKLSERKEYLKNVLAVDKTITIVRLQVIQAEIEIIDRLMRTPFALLELEESLKESYEEESEPE